MANTNTTPTYTTAATSLPSRRAFRQYFRARWQNMQNIVNDTVFYALVPPRFLTYYRAFIEQWLDWARGFVPQLHRQDFFSTGIGYTVCDIFARECMSGGWRIDSKDEQTAEFFEEYAAKGDFESLFNEMFFHANAGGNALLALTPNCGGVYASVYPVNRCIFDIGRTGDITHAELFNRFTTAAEPYYSMETRIMINGKGYYFVSLMQGSNNVVSPTWSRKQSLRDVPKEIRAQWEYCYGDIKPGQWYTLPVAIGIGLYNVKNKSVAVAISDLPGYSDSTLHTALDVLYSIDFNYTQQQMDMYWGRTRILLPKEMRSRNVLTSFPQNFTPTAADGAPLPQMHIAPTVDNLDDAFDAKAALGDDVYCKVVDQNSVDGKPIQPEFIQPDLRGEAHKYIRDADLELLASKVGLSSSTLANHLSYTQSKTATQVVAEMDTTEISVNNKRNLASVAVNAMLKAVARFYGLIEDVQIIWNKYGVNTPQENATLMSEYQAGLMTKREYLKRRFPDLTDDQVDKWIEELKAEDPPMQQAFNLGGF